MLARDVAAAVALPSFDNSAMDGYAARWAEVSTAAAEAPVRMPVAEDIPAGRTDVVPLAPGTVHRIMTGAPLPPGADVVVPVELTDGGTDVVEIRDVLPAGTHLRAAGEDIAAGAIALHRRVAARRRAARPGRRGGRHHAAGRAAVPASSCSRPAASSSAPGQPLLPGQIYESNSQLLVAAVEEAGGEARRLHFVPDDVDQFLTTVRSETGRRGPADHQRRRQRRGLRGGEGRVPRAGHRRVRQGGDAARRTAGRRAPWTASRS